MPIGLIYEIRVSVFTISNLWDLLGLKEKIINLKLTEGFDKEISNQRKVTQLKSNLSQLECKAL